MKEIEKLRKENKTLKEELALARGYGLKWREVEEENEGIDYTILEDTKREISSNCENEIEHLFYEGDNLLSLRELEKTHKGAVDVIYIDPPYNTGNEFTYSDKTIKFKKDNHSAWLSFMSKRLELARRLLSNSGVVFISIDDKELYQLKILMDSIFGEENFRANIIRKESPKRQKIGQVNIKTEHEYILVYTKTNEYNFNYVKEKTYVDYNKIVQNIYKKYKDLKLINEILTGKMDITSYDNYLLKERTKIVQLQEMNRGLKQYKYYDSTTERVFRESDIAMYVGSGERRYRVTHDGNEIFIPKKGLPELEKLKELVEIDVDDENKVINIVGEIEEIEEDRYVSGSVIFKYGTILGYKNNLEFESVPVTDMRNYMGSDQRLMQNMEIKFDFPKRVDMVKYLVELSSNKDSIILDFFAGSGTTGHAVLELNEEDGGNRQFILCTNNEVSEEKVRNYFHEQGLIPKPNKTEFNKFKKENPTLVLDFMKSDKYQELGIARSVTHKRLSKVIHGYKTPKGKVVKGLKGNRVKYYRVFPNKEE